MIDAHPRLIVTVLMVLAMLARVVHDGFDLAVGDLLPLLGDIACTVLACRMSRGRDGALSYE